ncbi:dihydrolipoyl dehydrogenase [Aureococcus anophagefferens]|nr:dihydrolipoyl dehydrogenase [Aureococcus anophagefferens]
MADAPPASPVATKPSAVPSSPQAWAETLQLDDDSGDDGERFIDVAVERSLRVEREYGREEAADLDGPVSAPLRLAFEDAARGEVVGDAARPRRASSPPIGPRRKHNLALLDLVHPRKWSNPAPGVGATDPWSWALAPRPRGGAQARCAGADGAGRGVPLRRRVADVGLRARQGPGARRAVRPAARSSLAHELGVNAPVHKAADFGAVARRMRRLRARLAAADAPKHLEKRHPNLSVFSGTAEFVSEDCVEVAADGDRRRLAFAHCIVATGASPALPDVPGLREAPYRTHLSWYDCEELPRRAVVLGGGPQAAETAQALSVLGCRVCLAARGEFLPREDAAAASVVRRELEADGVEILTNVSFVAVSVDEAEALPVGVAIRETNDFYASEKRVLRCDALLVAAGRKRAWRLAHVGLYERDVAGGCDVYETDLAHVDRAILDGDEGGLVRVVTARGSDEILGRRARAAGARGPGLYAALAYGAAATVAAVAAARRRS